MKRSLRWLSLLSVGFAMIRPAAGLAQFGTGGGTEPVGMWERLSSHDPSSSGSKLQETLNVRDDSTALHTRIETSGADTTVCTTKMRWGKISSDSIWIGSPKGKGTFDEINLVYAPKQVYVRVDSLKRARTSYPAPRAGAVKGVLAKLVGTWDEQFEPKRGAYAGYDKDDIRHALTVRPDGSWAETVYTKSDADTLSCTGTGEFSIVGDSLWWGQAPRRDRAGTAAKVVVKDQGFSLLPFRDTAQASSRRYVYTRVAAP